MGNRKKNDDLCYAPPTPISAVDKAPAVPVAPTAYSNPDAYQADAISTRAPFLDMLLPAFDAKLVFSALEIASEAGEVAGIVYKYVFQQHPWTDETRQKFLLELGDVLWGIASACDTIDAQMSEVMGANRAKLVKRYGQGRFTPADSIARVDVETTQGSAPAPLIAPVPPGMVAILPGGTLVLGPDDATETIRDDLVTPDCPGEAIDWDDDSVPRRATP